ncbi:MAG: hypothetical protein J6U72_01330 [Clostridia bacterium]|nr:hypothetical protein [Clostridia bacterium]
MGNLSIRELRRLADRLSADTGAREVTDRELYRNYFAKIPVPIIAKGRDGTLWVDRYYAAYQKGDGDVRYVYVALRHACEELGACRASQSLEGQAPPEVLRQLRGALESMKKAGKSVWTAGRDGAND